MRAIQLSPIAIIATLAVCSGAEPNGPAGEVVTVAGTLAIVDVNVVPMDRERVLRSHTLIIRDGRIAAMGPSNRLAPAAGTPIIDGANRYLLPGLIDMHVHIRAADLPAYVPNGVTTVRNMWGFTQLPAIMRDVERGARQGPHITSLTAGFDGSPPQWPETQLSDDVRQIEPMIAAQVAAGFREIKVYQRLSRAAYDTIVAIATRRGLTFAGHTPSAVGLDRVLQAHQRSIEHLGGYTVGTSAAQARATASAGTYNCPTLAILAMLDPGGVTARRNIVRALQQAGAAILVGTDAGIDRTQPGVAIHDELAQLVAAGLSRFEALSGATRIAAEYLGLQTSIGTIAENLEADLLLVRGDPLRDISATRAIEAVVLNGVRVR